MITSPQRAGSWFACQSRSSDATKVPWQCSKANFFGLLLLELINRVPNLAKHEA